MNETKQAFTATKIQLFLFVFFIKALALYGQSGKNVENFDPTILGTSIYNTGIYKDLDQFLSNSPDNSYLIQLNFREDASQIVFSAKENILLYLDPNTNKFKRYTGSNWGVCINNRIYIKHSGKYIALKPIGRFSFFQKEGWKISQSYDLNTIPPRAPKPYTKDYFIDLKTDKRYKLNIANVIHVLNLYNKSLHQQFLDEKYKKYVLEKYIEKLNNSL